jgi:hypothetical protein
MTSSKMNNLFITGCDAKTEWMLPWFMNNFRKHNSITPIQIFDFGMSPAMHDKYSRMITQHRTQDPGWFKKPSAMLKASKMSEKIVWLDTDCEIRDNVEDIFDRIVPNKLSMAIDQPWSNRRGEPWHNSGVVGFQNQPQILKEWVTSTMFTDLPGDQEVLHTMVKSGMKRMMHIEDLPKMYNTLRLDIMDNTTPKNIKIMHWTGQKGKEEIRKQIKND